MRQPWGFGPPAVSDCCGTNVSVSLITSNSTVLDPCQTLWEGTWQATDCAGNSTVYTQLVLVVETAPPIRGGSDSAWKAAKLETGLEIMVPLIIETGETVRVDTQSGKYAGKENTEK